MSKFFPESLLEFEWVACFVSLHCVRLLTRHFLGCGFLCFYVLCLCPQDAAPLCATSQPPLFRVERAAETALNDLETYPAHELWAHLATCAAALTLHISARTGCRFFISPTQKIIFNLFCRLSFFLMFLDLTEKFYPGQRVFVFFISYLQRRHSLRFPKLSVT